jgi:Dienelactone hydrolase and related enzymes
VHDWDGATSYEKKRADMLAELGYDAFAVDLYGKGNRPAEIADKKKETGRLLADRERMRKLLLAGLEEARRGGDRPVVVIGYCFGGAAALELARSGQAKNVVGYATFHGGLATPEGQSYPSTTPPIFVAHGGADTSVTMDDVAALSRQLEQAGVQYEIQVYSGAPHGFTNFESERYQKRADERSWSAFTNSLTEVFGS